jgi:hypothetical protein
LSEYFSTPDEEALQGRASDLDSSFGEQQSAVAGEGFLGTTRGLARNAEYVTARGIPAAGLNMSDMPTVEDFDLMDKIRAESTDVPIADAQGRLKQEGITDVKLPDQPTIRSSVLDLMIRDAQERQHYEAAVSRGPQGFFPGAFGFVTSIGVGLLDPLNAEAFMIPVVGEARAEAMLASAGESMLARGAVRFGTGAAQGAVGSAALEPADWWLHTQDGQDYTYADALTHVIQGAAMGGVMHAGIGAYGDWRDLRSGLPLSGSPEDRLARALLTGGGPGEGGAPGGGEAAPLLAEVPGIAAAQAAADTPRAIFDDLPPPVRADLAHVAAADMAADRPGRAGEVLEIAAQHDPRLAESLDVQPPEPPAAPPAPTSAERAIYDDVHAQLTAAGMGEEEAATNAALVAARYAARAARLGEDDAHALFAREGLSIRGAGDQGAEPAMRALAQPPTPMDLMLAREAAGQLDLPGAERVGEGELAQRRADERLKPKVAQRPMDEGLFGDTGAQKTLFQSAPAAPPFYSAAERAVRNARQEKASPEQWLATTRNTAGVKAEELEWLGLADWLKEQQGPVTRQAIADYVRANSIEVREVHKGAEAAADQRRYDALHLVSMMRDLTEAEDQEWSSLRDRLNDRRAFGTRYNKYQLPGGENYRELLLTLPPEQREPVGDRYYAKEDGADDWNVYDRDTGEPTTYGTMTHNREWAESTARSMNTPPGPPAFTSVHWDEPNVLVHVRFNDRTIDGKRTLLLEEVQSDWHQAGRKRGYQGHTRADAEIERDIETNLAEARRLDPRLTREGVTADDWQAFWDAHPDLDRRQSELYRERGVGGRAVPDAPFKTTWPELAIKRMLRYAAEHGYEQLAWAPGDVQAARYDLSKQIQEVAYHTDLGHPHTGTLLAYDHERNAVINRNLSDAARELPDIVGKDVADKLLAQKPKQHLGTNRLTQSLRGLDLKVGGEGMRAFYDQMLPAAANKLAKKYGAKVGEARLERPKYGPLDQVPFPEPTDSRAAHQVHTLPITDALRDAATSEGFPLFQPSRPGVDVAAQLKGDELAPAGVPIAELRQAASGYYREHFVDADLKVRNAATGFEIAFSGRGQRKSTSGAGDDLLRLVPALPDMLRGAQLVGSGPDRLGRQSVRAVHTFASAVELDGRRIDVIMHVRETGDGKFHYSLYKDQPDEGPGTGQEGRRANTLDQEGTLPALEVVPGDLNIERAPADRNGARGRIMLAENRAIVDLFKGRDESTFMHEMGHKWLEELMRDGAGETAPAGMQADLAATLKWLGVDKPEDIGVDQHEKFARGFERYLAEGESPSVGLQRVFENFKAWLLKVYHAITNVGGEISPEMRGVFDRMLATDTQIAARRGAAEPAAPLTPTLSPQERGEGAPAPAPAAAPARRAFGPAGRDPDTWSLAEFLASRGGLKPTGELATIFGGENPNVFGFGRLMRRDGMTLDRAREAAVEAGYLHDEAVHHGGVTESGVEDLLAALDRHGRGERVYKIGREPDARVDRGEHLHAIDRAIDQELADNDVDPKSIPDKLRARMVEMMDREGVSDPLVAYERAVLEEDRNAVTANRAPAGAPVAGFDVPADAAGAPGAGAGAARGGAGRAGAAARPARASDPATAASDPAWRRLAEQRDPDAQADLAVSEAAEREPAPASTDPARSVKAAQAEAAKAEAALKDLDPFLSDEERTRINTALADLDNDRAARERIIRDGAACLMAAAGGVDG